MESNQSLLHLFLFFLLLGIASSSHISNGFFDPNGSLTGRSLLQQKATCNVDFENLNYTIITSKCKGPHYTKERCCPPLKQLMCPYTDEINNLSSDCADEFFSYTNLYGKYPPGLFASLCKDGQAGIDCRGIKHTNSAANAGLSFIAMISAAAVLMIFYI